MFMNTMSACMYDTIQVYNVINTYLDNVILTFADA